jgi:hypothetical protein
MQPGIEGEGKDPVSVEATLVRIRRWHKRRAQEDPDATVVKGRVAQKIEASTRSWSQLWNRCSQSSWDAARPVG